MRRHRLPVSQEEKVAKRIGTILSDFSLDLEQVGKYISVALPHTVYMIAVVVLESAQYNKEVSEYDERHKYYKQGQLF